MTNGTHHSRHLKSTVCTCMKPNCDKISKSPCLKEYICASIQLCNVFKPSWPLFVCKSQNLIFSQQYDIRFGI